MGYSIALGQTKEQVAHAIADAMCNIDMRYLPVPMQYNSAELPMTGEFPLVVFIRMVEGMIMPLLTDDVHGYYTGKHDAALLECARHEDPNEYVDEVLQNTACECMVKMGFIKESDLEAVLTYEHL